MHADILYTRHLVVLITNTMYMVELDYVKTFGINAELDEENTDDVAEGGDMVEDDEEDGEEDEGEGEELSAE